MTHASFFNEAQTSVRTLFQQQHDAKQAEAERKVVQRNQRIAEEAGRVTRNLTAPQSHGFTSVSGDERDSFYQQVVNILGPQVKIYKVIEKRDDGPRERNYYACQCPFGQIEQHLKRQLRSYYIEHMGTFEADPATQV